MREKGLNPFTPDRPVQKENFIGRKLEVSRMLRSAHQVSLGKNEHIFIAGEYGIGKSSLASYVKYAALEKFNLAGFHIYLGGVDSIEGMVQKVVESIIEDTYEIKSFDKVKEFLGKYVKEFDIFGLKINTELLRRDVPDIAAGFLPFLRQVYGSLSSDYKGISLIMDDLNGISQNPQFAFLLKSMVDNIATGSTPLPMMLILSGVEQRRREIVSHHQSVARIFSVVEVLPLSDADITQFFVSLFTNMGYKIEDNALYMAVKISSGLPRLMHEIGSGIFWSAENDVISLKTVFKGRSIAVNELGKKYFGSLQNIFKTDEYRSILKKIIKHTGEYAQFPKLKRFEKRSIADLLEGEEKAKFDNFLQKLKKMNVIQPGAQKGEWTFTDHLTFWYFQTETENN